MELRRRRSRRLHTRALGCSRHTQHARRHRCRGPFLLSRLGFANGFARETPCYHWIRIAALLDAGHYRPARLPCRRERQRLLPELRPPETLTQLEMHFSVIATTLPCLRLFLRAWNTSFMDMRLQELDPQAYEQRTSRLSNSSPPTPINTLTIRANLIPPQTYPQWVDHKIDRKAPLT